MTISKINVVNVLSRIKHHLNIRFHISLREGCSMVKCAHHIGALIILSSTAAVGSVRGSSAIKLISKGNEHYRNGKLGAAIKCYNQAIQLEPGNSVAWNNKGLILAIAGQYEEALVAHSKALEIDPGYVDAISNMGMAYTKLDKYDEALTQYNLALKKRPDHEIAWNNKGNLLAKMERHEDAMECYEKALKINPKYHAAMNNKAVGLGHLKRYNEAIDLLNKVLKQKPTFAEGWYVKGKAYIGQGRFEKAIVCFERAYRLDNEFHQAKRAMDILKRRLVEDPGKKAKKQKSKKREKPKDMKKLKAKIEADIMEVGEELDVLGDEFKDDEHLTKDESVTLEFLTDDPISRTALKKTMGGKISIPALERALQGLTKKGLVVSQRSGRGFSYSKTEALGAIDEEIVEEAGKAKSQEESPLGDFHSLVDAGRKMLTKERYKDALKNFRRALIINPYDEMAICMKAQSHYELDQRDKAINTMSQILTKKPDFLPAWFTLANVTLKHGEYEESADCFRKILDIQPDNSEAKKGLEECEKALKK